MLDKFFKLRKQQRRQLYFFRGREGDRENLKYAGNIRMTDPYNKISAISWLLRFGGYKEVRTYDSKTKRLLYTFTLKEFDDYCWQKGINNFVLKDSTYLNVRNN